MTLLAEVVGVLFGGAVIAALLQLAGPPAFIRAVGVAMVVAAVASVLFFENVWGLSSSFSAAIKANGALSRQAAELAGAMGTNTGFLSWSRMKIVNGHETPSFWLAPDAARENSVIYQWSTYQLLPARETDLAREANWIVFYGVNPAEVAYDHTAFGRLFVYARGFALAQRTDAR